MKPVKRKVLKHIIRGDKWKIVLMDPIRYVKENDADSSACCDVTKKIIYFRTDDMTSGIVTHEMTHAYISYLHYEDANLELQQLEEMICTMIQSQGQELLDCAKNLWDQIKEYKIDIDTSQIS